MARRQAVLKAEITRENETIQIRLEDERKALWAERERWQQETAETRSRLAQGSIERSTREGNGEDIAEGATAGWRASVAACAALRASRASFSLCASSR